MGKRKKKSGRRRKLAISAFGLRGVAERYETAPLYQRKFQASDMVWLAEEYQRRNSADPSLTPEDFAAQYGVSADEFRLYIPEEMGGINHCVTLWHGTTASRAQSILNQGFRAKKAKNKNGQIFFAETPKLPQGHAQNRARQEADDPAVIMCSVDLSHYSKYERRAKKIYVFSHECIGKEVIKSVTGIPRQRPEKPEKRKEAKDELTDVALTFGSARSGIAYWINSCLKLRGSDIIHQDHEAVGKIKDWLDAQADAGRFGEVPNDEMLDQVREHLPQYSE